MPQNLVIPEIGALLGERYRVEETLGRGGMAVVLAVRDESTGEPLAVKLLGPLDHEESAEPTADTAERAARLIREARAAMRITSEHVVRVRDLSTDPAFGAFLVMERLSGTDLADAWQPGTKMPVREAANIGLQVCEALSHAHAAGIVHRDIKPSNLFLTRGPDGDVLKVLDFGISKVMRRADWERTQGTLTVGDAVLGSPQFVSPEQLRDSRTVDARTDIWSLGVVLYRLVTGTYPFSGETIGQLFTRILERDPRPLTDHGVDDAAALQPILDRCLARSVDARYPHVADLARDLAPLADPRWMPLAETIGARAERWRAPTPSVPPAPLTTEPAPVAASGAVPPPRRRRLVSLVTVAVLGAAGLGALGFVRRLPAAEPGPTTVDHRMPTEPPRSAATPTTSSEAGGVLLTIRADAPIETVRAAGLRRVTLEGDHATLMVNPWADNLDIEAELAGGGRARGSVALTGSHMVHLTTLAPPGPSAAPRVARPGNGAGRPSRQGGQHDAGAIGSGRTPGPPTAVASAPPGELHGNPYARPNETGGRP